jgi:1-deoxyxylulose-5-phosphate synthase
MKYVNLGKTGITVSKLTLGMMSFGNSQEWQLEIDEARPIIEKAIDLGINHFDTANVYSNGRSEEITGELLNQYRDQVVISTKCRFAMDIGVNDKGLNRKHLLQQINHSLNRLKTDFIDLYQIHRWDYNVAIEYVLRSLNHFIDDGLVGHIGASSMFAWELSKAQYTADRLGLERFATMQNHYNAIYREEEREMIPMCIDMEMGILPWSPLARGFLSGKYKSNETLETKRLKSDPYLKERYFRENDFNILNEIIQIASEIDATIPQIALAWLLSQKGVTSPIIGVTNISQLEELITSVELKLNADYIKRINEKYLPKSIIGHSYNQSDSMVNVSR